MNMATMLEYLSSLECTTILDQCMNELYESKSHKENIQIMTKHFADKLDDTYSEKVKKVMNFKSASQSVSFRKDGNSAFVNSEYIKAILSFNDSISHAPNKSTELAIAYGNRSAVLRHIGKLMECLADIRQAFYYGYPEKMRYKLFLRQAQCLRDLDEPVFAEETFDMALEALQFSTLPEGDKEQYKSYVKTEKRAGKQVIEDVHKILIPTETPELSYGRNSEVPCVSRALDLRYNDNVGRQFVANRDIKIGDVLAVEDPFSCSQSSMTNNLPMCSHCMRPSFTLQPCPRCTWAMFCSEKCKSDAFKEYHMTECVIVSRFLLLHGSTGFEYTFQIIRCISQVGLKNLQKYFYIREPPLDETKEAKRTRGFNENGKYDSSDLLTVLNLCCCNKNNTYDKFISSFMALEVSKCFYPFNYLKKENMSVLILKLYDVFSKNSIRIQYVNFKKDDLQQLVPFNSHTTAIYPASSLFNHSCAPNAIITFYGSKLVLRAHTPILKSNEAFLPYFTLFFSADKKTRQTHLYKAYNFKCKCSACVNDWPRFESLPVLSRKELTDLKVLRAWQEVSHLIFTQSLYTCFSLGRNSLSDYLDTAMFSRSKLNTVLCKNKKILNKNFIICMGAIVNIIQCHGNIISNF